MRNEKEEKKVRLVWKREREIVRRAVLPQERY